MSEKTARLHDDESSVYEQFRQREARYHTLNYLFWECTRRCNLHCLHCGSDCVAYSNHPDMPFSDFLRAIIPLKDAYKRDSITIAITGGEPLLRDDLFDCGRSLRAHGFRWGIVTNGYAYSPEVHGRLLGAGMGSVTVSLDGLENTHNWLRDNKDSFEKAVNAIRLIATSERLAFDVVTCVNRKNLDELPGIKNLLIALHVKKWRLFTIDPIGRAANAADMQLTPIELRQLLDFIAHTRMEKKMPINFDCEGYLGSYEKRVSDSFFFCRAGVHIGSILIDGSISACPNINRSFVQGNIYQDSFFDVWNARFEIMRYRTWTKTGICMNCEDYRQCLGGPMHSWDEKKDSIMICNYALLNKTGQGGNSAGITIED